MSLSSKYSKILHPIINHSRERISSPYLFIFLITCHITNPTINNIGITANTPPITPMFKPKHSSIPQTTEPIIAIIKMVSITEIILFFCCFIFTLSHHQKYLDYSYSSFGLYILSMTVYHQLNQILVASH